MKWFVGVLLALAMAMPPLLASEPELPSDGGEEAMEIDPPLLLPHRSIDEFLAIAAANRGTPATPAAAADIEKLEKDLARAKTRAASGDRLFRAGIIAKVDAEERALRVVRLEAQLAEAQLAHAKQQAAAEAGHTVEINASPASPSRAIIAEAAAAAQRAAAEQHRAELEAAAINLKRQQKLLALGSGRKADVSRAQKRLAELQQPKE
ncbi:MAG: hypothetical protein H0V56_06800 [Chthoniobacterales bacterium]|nr:hypothetical protein [Chthoniobacterales bacterium]